MAKKSQQDPEPVEEPVAPAESELVTVSAARPRMAWWPIAALSVLLLAFAATMVTIPGVSPIRPDAKSAFLEATPRLEGMAPVVAPEPTVTPDPKSFAQKIDIILPPPPPPAKSGGRKSGGGGGGVALNKADAGAFCAQINAQRTAVGLSALAACFATSARQSHANSMAATFPVAIWHQGDNIVGVSDSVSRMMTGDKGFMNSPPHKAQILTPTYTGARVGCAWGKHPGYVPLIYCTADFY